MPPWQAFSIPAICFTALPLLDAAFESSRCWISVQRGGFSAHPPGIGLDFPAFRALFSG